MMIYNLNLYRLKQELNSLGFKYNLSPAFKIEFNNAINKIITIDNPMFQEKIELIFNFIFTAPSKMSLIILADKLGLKFIDIYSTVLIILSIYLAQAQIAPSNYEAFVDELLKGDVYTIFKEKADELLQSNCIAELMIQYHEIFASSNSSDELHIRTLRLFSSFRSVVPSIILSPNDTLITIHSKIKEEMLNANNYNLRFIKNDFDSLDILLKLNLKSEENVNEILEKIFDIENKSTTKLEFIRNLLVYLDTEKENVKLNLTRKKED